MRMTCGAPPARVVGRPEKGERICPTCNGSGNREPFHPMYGCDACEGTGVISEIDLAARDARAGGIGILKDGKRIDPADFYAPPPEDGPLDSALNKDRTGKHGSEVG